jgi:NADH:ubiquinone oxidoreductase subunit
MIDIDTVFEVLSDNTKGRVWMHHGYVAGEPGSGRYYARNSPLNSVLDNTDVVTVDDFFLGAIHSSAGEPNHQLVEKANKILDTMVWFPEPAYPDSDDPRNVWTPATEKIEELKEVLREYLQGVALFNADDNDPSYSSAGAKHLSGVASRIKSKTKNYFGSLQDTKGDISQIGFYPIPESENSHGLPVIIPSSINIQESLLNQPVPVVRSKSVGVIPDHRSKHIVSIDIVFPNFETFSSREEDYPSFINLYNMFKFMPINSIYSPALCMAFVSEYTYPRFFDLVKEIYTSDEFSDIAKIQGDQARAAYVVKDLDLQSPSQIKELFNDPAADIGMSAIADLILGKNNIASDDSRKKVLDFVSGGQGNGPAQFPVPVCFKSASLQTAADMPGAIIGRFTFGIVSSPAFPYGNVLYRDRDGKSTFDPYDCKWGKKYVSVVSQKLVDQIDIDMANTLGSDVEAGELNLRPELGPNDLRLHYHDIAHGSYSFDTTNPRYSRANGSPAVLEKISGAFNTKSIDLHLLGSKFPNCQYMGMNSNSIQMIFSVTDKRVISDFMAMKAKIVDSEKAKTLFNSYAIIENTLVNSLGVTRVTPQSLTIESDSDNPELYRLIVNFVENYERLGSKEKLQLEKGVTSVKPLEMFWDYLYDLYRIWAYHHHIPKDSYSADGFDAFKPLSDHYTGKNYLEKLDKLMDTIGIKADYVDSDKTTPTVLNAGGRGAHGVYYGPLLMGIISEYAKMKNGTSQASGILEYDFPELIDPARLLDAFDEILSDESTVMRNHIEDFIYAMAVGYKETIVYGGYNTGGVHETTYDSNSALLTILDIGNSQSIKSVYRLARFDNLVDMFHENKTIIPKPIWDSTLKCILGRTHTAGKDVLVMPQQMDRAFTMLHSLVSRYEPVFTFDTKGYNEAGAGESTRLTMLRGSVVTSGSVTHPPTALQWATHYTDITKPTQIPPGYKDLIIHNLPSISARLDLKKMKEIQKDINDANNQIINLYPDMYLPTYGELLRGEEGYDVNTDDPGKNDEARKNRKRFMEAFAPRCGDRGVIPDLDLKTMLTADIDILSDTVAVTEDHFIDPDIFYYRDRDKNNMCILAKNWTEDDTKAEQELLSTGKTIPLPINFSHLWETARQNLIDKNEMNDALEVTYENARILAEIQELFSLAISNTAAKITEAGAAVEGVNEFSHLGVSEMTPEANEKINDFIKALQTKSDDPRLNSVIHLEFITQDGMVIGNVNKRSGEKGVPYSVSLDISSIGGSPIYYNPVDNMSFALDLKSMNNVEKQQIAHMEDLTDSVLKSFPTIRLYFIEEDRDQSYYNDDFYGFGDIIECSISSHIYDNDICTMKLANFSGTLSTQSFTNYQHYIKIREPSSEENSKTAPTTNQTTVVSVVDEEHEKFLKKIMLRPGIHIMVKMGYGNNIDHLKTVFTGEIAEVKAGSIVEIVAQGYQTELHSQFGGFMEESWTENFGAIFEWGEDESNKFNFLKIINYILLENDGEAKRLLRGGMKHLGKPFSSESYQKGLWGDVNSKYDYADSSNDIRRILGSEYETTQDFLADAQGEEFSWFDSLMESRYLGFSGNDVTRNVYIASSNNTNINLTNEWLITNAPVIDSLREVVRYMPNFIATVVPYHQDATLFIGDPTGPYQYRKPTAKESEYNIKFNAGNMMARRDQANFKDLNNEYNLLIREINKLNSSVQADIDYYNAKKQENSNYVGRNESAIAELQEMLSSVYFTPLDIEVSNKIHSAIFENYFRLSGVVASASTSKEMCRFHVPFAVAAHGYKHAKKQAYTNPAGGLWDESWRSQKSGSRLSLAYNSRNSRGEIQHAFDDFATIKINGEKIRITGIDIDYPLAVKDSGEIDLPLYPTNSYDLVGGLGSYNFDLGSEVQFGGRGGTASSNRVVVINKPMFGQNVTGYGQHGNSFMITPSGKAATQSDINLLRHLHSFSKSNPHRIIPAEPIRPAPDFSINELMKDLIDTDPYVYPHRPQGFASPETIAAREDAIRGFFGGIWQIMKDMVNTDVYVYEDRPQGFVQRPRSEIEEEMRANRANLPNIFGQSDLLVSPPPPPTVAPLGGLEDTSEYINAIFGYKKCMALVKAILSGSSAYVDDDIANVLNGAFGGSKRIELNAMPWNYKIFRDNHVLSSEHDLIANNIVATESDMWSAVGLRVPIDTISETQGIGEWGLFKHGIKEGGVERGAGVYKIDPDQEFGIYPSKTAGGINYQGRYPGPKDILETFTEINATSPNLAQNVFKFRLAQGLSKMYRGNIISIGRNIKPYDSVQIVDNVNLIYGKVMAERVIQNFSSINGWTTTIIPCGLTRVNSKQASLNVSASDKWMYFLSKGKTFNYISNAMTIASLGTIGLGVKGTALFLAKGLPRTLSRIGSAAIGRGGPGALWSAAKIPLKYGARINLVNLRAGSSFGLRFAQHAKFAAGSFLGGNAASGTADVIHQFMNMNISQTVALKTGTGKTITAHQPAQVSILTYAGGPFMAGLEDPYESMTNHDSWAELYDDFEYGFREWTTRPDRGGVFDAGEAIDRNLGRN